MSFERRPLRPSDAAAWARQLVAVGLADGDDEYYGEAELIEEFGDPYRDYGRGSIGIFDGPALAGYGLLNSRSAADPVHEMRYEGSVHPSYRGRGLGGELLAWAESAAVPLHEERFRGRPLVLHVGCLAGNAAATALIKARGYHLARVFYSMERDLAQPIAEASLADGLRVEGFTFERSEDARLVRNEAFRDHWGSVESSPEYWAHQLGTGTFRPAFSYVMYSGSEPAGILLSHEYAGHTAQTGRRDLYIALVATRAAGRKRGIASALLTRVMTAGKAGGFQTASLNVDSDSLTGAVALYERARFAVKVTWTAYGKELR
jgi:GNAT superfamily N-acetyltransferase